ncbi:MAG TPA: FliA/WhiG family RNA polymerase sigma factor [Bryobacteraceae bacterium]|nr:FliA/WhiG family RNA polymerase sigma factor [Bryobacteraceae bacterium]
MRQTSTATRATKTVSKETRDRVVLDHLPLVKAIAVRVHESLPVHVDLDDLIHAGILGLFDAASKYDPEKQVVFQSYAKHRIRGAILDSLRQMDWASRDLRKRQKQLDTVTRELSAKLGRTPTELEIAEALGVGVERWRHMLMELRTVGLVTASSRPPQYEDNAPPEYPAPPEFQPDLMCNQERLRQALSNAVQCLPERYQKVVFLYYTDELTMKEIGEILGVNESRVSQIHKSALSKMATVLHSAGIHSAEAF